MPEGQSSDAVKRARELLRIASFEGGAGSAW
jgi:hypothetical protein